MSTEKPPAGDAGEPTERAPFVARIAEAMAEAQRVEKDGTNPEHNYKYASIEAVLAEVRAPLLTRGVILLPSVESVEEKAIRSRSGSEGTAATLTMTFTFRDGYSDATLAVNGWKGQGQDYGDKAYGKAYTNAIKTFVRTAWLLPTGDDPEAESPDRVGNNAGAAAVPGWATAATKARLAELGPYLVPLFGREKALTVPADVEHNIGAVPDVVVATVKLLVDKLVDHNPEELMQGLEAIRRTRTEQEVQAERAEASKAEKARAEQDAAAEAPDEPADTSGQDDTLEEGEDEEPPDGATGTPQGPAPGSIEAKVPEGANEEAATRILRGAGCTCPKPAAPVTDAEAHVDTCPIQGHGIPF